MPLKTFQDEQPAMNMTPMIDVIFQLIIFFMVGTSFTQPENRIDLKIPAISNTARPATPPPDKKVVNVYQDGRVYLDGQTLTLEQLTSTLAAARSQYKSLGVTIRGDATLSLQRTAEVLQAVRRAGVADMGIAVKPTNARY
jgi:biopolymer transport protein ExbD